VDDRLYRSTTDRSISGVCGGVAAWLGLDPSLVRVAWVLLALVSGGLFVILYIAMAIVVPDAPPGWAPRGHMHPPGGPPGYGQTWDQRWGGGAAGGQPGGAWTGAPGWQPGAGSPDSTPPGTPPTSRPEDWSHVQRPTSGGSFSGDRAGFIAGGVLIVLGAWFLVKDYVPINWDLVWPVAIIALGGIMIAGAMRRRG
jgi:phage shock protein C